MGTTSVPIGQTFGLIGDKFRFFGKMFTRHGRYPVV